MSNPKYRITIVEDDKVYSEILKLALNATFSVNAFQCPEEGLNFIKTCATDAVLIDLDLDESNGYKLCEEIKQLKPEVAVFFLSKNSSVECIQRGFELGAIDYFAKSLSTSEIMTRAFQRIRLHFAPRIESKLECGDLRIDLSNNLAFHRNQELKLTSKEYELLKLFVENQNKVLSKKEILDCIWPNTHVDKNNIDTHLFNLRRKIKEGTSNIVCLKGRGFLLKA